MSAASVVGTIIGGGDTQTLLAVKKIELYALSGSGVAKTSSTGPHTRALATR